MSTMTSERLRITVIVALLVGLAHCHASTVGTRETNNSIVVGSMGACFTLPGFLSSREEAFVHNGKSVSPDARLHLIKMTSDGYQITVKYLTCTDEGTYTLGGTTFSVAVKPGQGGLLSFLLRVPKTYEIPIKPLSNDVRIFSVNASGATWTLNQVWNNTMNKNEILGVLGYGNEQRSFFVYQRRGRLEQACVDFTEASSGSSSSGSSSSGVIIPTLETLETIDTRIDLASLDIQQSITHTLELT